MLPTEYTETFQVYRHDGDCYGFVQPATVLRYAQQIAGEHAIGLGLDDALYARTHTAYVLVKQALHFDRVPRVDEHLTLITRPEALKRAVNKRITQVLDAARLTVDDVDRFVFHQANQRIIDMAVRRLKLPPEKCTGNIASTGNTSAASVPLLLDELVRSGGLCPGQRALCVGFGAGLTWGGALLEVGEPRLS